MHKDKTTTHEEFVVWTTDGMEWLKEIVRDEQLKDEWEWYAHHKLLVVEGKEPVRIIDEPLSADDAWEFEVSVTFIVGPC